MPSTVIRYTLSEFLNVAEHTPPNRRTIQETGSWLDREAMTWCDNLTTKQAIEKARTGDQKMAQLIEQEISKLEISLQTDRVFKSQAGFVGCVNVGAFLAGAPACMRSRQRAEALVRHVNVYINSGFSGGITIETAAKRGAAIIGLLDQIQKNGLGLTVHIISEYDQDVGICRSRGDEPKDLYHLIALEQPIDLSVVGFALTHPAFERAIGMTIADTQASGCGWPESYMILGGAQHNPLYVQHLQQALDMGPRDIYIPPMYYDDPMVRDPENWIKNTLVQIET